VYVYFEEESGRRSAANAALKAMSSWRNDIADTSEFNDKRWLRLPQR
jgi:hypothetical protein